jgi:hypothetical protein
MYAVSLIANCMKHLLLQVEFICNVRNCLDLTCLVQFGESTHVQTLTCNCWRWAESLWNFPVVCLAVQYYKTDTTHIFNFPFPNVQQIKHTAHFFKQRYWWHTETHSQQNKNVFIHFPSINNFTAVLLNIHTACPSQWRHCTPLKYQLTVCQLTCHKIPEGMNVHSLPFYLNPHINRSIQNALQNSSWYDTSPLLLPNGVY